MDELQIQRINELARKSKAEGLTTAEKEEQASLRREYIEAIRMNLRGQLNNIDVKETITTDITQVIKEVQTEAPAEVTFNLLKIGMTATVVSWVIETGNGSVI